MLARICKAVIPTNWKAREDYDLICGIEIEELVRATGSHIDCTVY